MSAFVIAGKADDPAFARVEYVAKQIEAVCPQIAFQFEMKNPDGWKDFLGGVLRKYDFAGVEEDCQGPLIWTLEGKLVGGSQEFIKTVSVQKFGVKAPAPSMESTFRQIAADNLRQLKQQQQREECGPPLGERCDVARAAAEAKGLLQPKAFTGQNRMVVLGCSAEVWCCPQLAEHFQANAKAYGNGQACRIAPELSVAPVGQEQSHLVLVHPQPVAQRHLVIVPRRHVRELTEAQRAKAEATGTEAQATEAVQAAATQEVLEAMQATETGKSEELEVPAEAAAEVQEGGSGAEVVALEVPPHAFRYDHEQDLVQQDFIAAMELLYAVGGLASWCGIRGATEYRHPLDTHIQLMPFPLGASGASQLRFPLELAIDRALRGDVKQATLPAFPFNHTLVRVGGGEVTNPLQAGKQALAAYELARSSCGSRAGSCSVAFTTSWLLFMPLAPPEAGTALAAAWPVLPPPPPVALGGVVIAPSLAPSYPEAAGGTGSFVSTRAIEEGIPECTEEFQLANREVRISTRILLKPMELMSVFGLPLAK